MNQPNSDGLNTLQSKVLPDSPNSSSVQSTVTPLRCFTGALISAPLAFALYSLTLSISQTFAAKPLISSSTMAIRISIMVRTLVMGMSALGTAIFAFTSLGVMALGFQLLIKQWSDRRTQS